MPVLFAPSSVVANFRGRGPALIEWRYRDRREPPVPYAEVIAGYDEAEAVARWVAEDLVRSYLTRDEARQLAAFLRAHHPAWFEGFRAPPAAPLPVRGAEARGEPAADAEVEWVVRLDTGPAVIEGLGRVPSLPVVGLAGRWPGGARDPHDPAAVLGLDDELGGHRPGEGREG